MHSYILVVDDEPAILDVYSMALTEIGFIPILAINGIDALERVISVKPVMAIVDMLMPQMNGVEFIQQVRSLKFYDLQQIPIVAVSAGQNMRTLALKAGASVYLEKPFDVEELLNIVQSYARVSSSRSSVFVDAAHLIS